MGKSGYNAQGEWTVDNAVEDKTKRRPIKRGLLVIGGGLSVAWLGPLLPACVAGTYIAGRYALKQFAIDDRKPDDLAFTQSSLKGILATCVAVICAVEGIGEYSGVRDKFFAPEKVARKAIIVDAGKEILSGKDQVAICEPYFKPMPWLAEKTGSQGAKIRDVCVTGTVTERQGLQAVARLSVNGEPTYLEAFRPKDSDSSPGYDKAVEVPLVR